MISTFWQAHAETIDLENFRASPQFLDTSGYDYPRMYEACQWVNPTAFNLLREDGAFGCETVEIDGRTVSRDLLDAVLETWFLTLNCPLVQRARILDIGAGYGRFAHRATTLWPEALVYCSDAVPVARQACARYIAHRKCDRVLLLGDLADGWLPPCDLAVNIHSWSECTLPEVCRWLDALRAHEVQQLFIVPHNDTFGVWDPLLGGGAGPSYLPELTARGYREAFTLSDAMGVTYHLFYLEGT